MVLRAAGSAHGNRALGTVEDYSDVGQVEPRRVVSELCLEFADVLCYLRRNDVQNRVQPLVTVVCADPLFEILDPQVELAVFTLKPSDLYVWSEIL